MAYFRTLSGGGGNITDLADFIRDRVLNGGYSTKYDLIPYSDRTSINEGGVAVDEDNRLVYLYCDFDVLSNQSTNYWLTETSPVMPDTYKVIGTSSFTVETNILLDRITSVSTSANITYRSLKFSKYSASLVGIATNTMAVKAGERYKLYFAWHY